ncbi:MAG: hypothetical protein SGARI_000560 [Bacillariaceae sp.]
MGNCITVHAASTLATTSGDISPASSTPTLQLGPASTLSSATPSPANENQISAISRNEKITAKEEAIRALAKAWVQNDVGLDWDELTEAQKGRAMEAQIEPFAWSSNSGAVQVTPPDQRYATMFKKEWNGFLASIPRRHRRKLASFEHVIFDKQGIEDYMSIHVVQQPSGVFSSLAGAATFQHLAETSRSKTKEKNHHKMLDTSAFIRNHLPTELQQRYILEGVTGMSAFDLLQAWTGTESTDFVSLQLTSKSEETEFHERDVAAVRERLLGTADEPKWTGFQRKKRWEPFQQQTPRQKTPGLVSLFKIGDEFLNNSILEGPFNTAAWEIKRDKKERGIFHAMVLIGCYKCNDRYWFVLQNTHKGDYFKIVDSEYFASNQAKLYFAYKSADMSLKSNYKIVEGDFIEAAAAMEECMPPVIGEG